MISRRVHESVGPRPEAPRRRFRPATVLAAVATVAYLAAAVAVGTRSFGAAVLTACVTAVLLTTLTLLWTREASPPTPPAPPPPAAPTRQFSAQLVFAETRGPRIVIDGLVVTPDVRGPGRGAPFCLVVRRPGTFWNDDLVLSTARAWCTGAFPVDVEIDDTGVEPTVRLSAPDCAVVLDLDGLAGVRSPSSPSR